MNVEAVVMEYLKNNGINATVHIPRPRPEKFVSIERTGGNKSDVVLDHPMITVQSWAKSRYEASELACIVDVFMLAIPDYYINICSCTRNSLYSFPDPESDTPRYQAVYDLVVQD